MFWWVAFRSGILLLAPAQETAKVDPAHVVSGCDSVTLAPCGCSVFVGRQALADSVFAVGRSPLVTASGL
jgi:hypothetical protein